jgi:hypothetical protein
VQTFFQNAAVTFEEDGFKVVDSYYFDFVGMLLWWGKFKLLKSKKGKYCTKPSLLDEFCTENNIEHRLTKPATPKTNGMVERVNGTIKNGTIKRNQYQNIEELETDLKAFLIAYNSIRRHGGLRKELNVKTPFQALDKWYEINPELFFVKPDEFKNKILHLQSIK